MSSGFLGFLWTHCLKWWKFGAHWSEVSCWGHSLVTYVLLSQHNCKSYLHIFQDRLRSRICVIKGTALILFLLKKLRSSAILIIWLLCCRAMVCGRSNRWLLWCIHHAWYLCKWLLCWGGLYLCSGSSRCKYLPLTKYHNCFAINFFLCDNFIFKTELAVNIY